jgi:transposase
MGGDWRRFDGDLAFAGPAVDGEGAPPPLSPPRPPGAAMEAIWFVMRTGCPWRSPNATTSRSSAIAERCFRECGRAGVFERLHQSRLDVAREAGAIDWSARTVDGRHARIAVAHAKRGPSRSTGANRARNERRSPSRACPRTRRESGDRPDPAAGPGSTRRALRAGAPGQAHSPPTGAFDAERSGPAWPHPASLPTFPEPAQDQRPKHKGHRAGLAGWSSARTHIRAFEARASAASASTATKPLPPPPARPPLVRLRGSDGGLSF